MAWWAIFFGVAVIVSSMALGQRIRIRRMDRELADLRKVRDLVVKFSSSGDWKQFVDKQLTGSADKLEYYIQRSIKFQQGGLKAVVSDFDEASAQNCQELFESWRESLARDIHDAQNYFYRPYDLANDVEPILLWNFGLRGRDYENYVTEKPAKVAG